MARSPAEALEPVRPPRPRGGHKPLGPGKYVGAVRIVSGLLTLAAVTLGGLGVAGVWFFSQLQGAGPLTGNKFIVVKKGESVRDLAARLKSEGVILSRNVFLAYYYGRNLIGHKPINLKAGDYEIGGGATMREVLGIIGEGKAILYRLTVPEGLTSYQIVERVKADQNLTGEVAAVPAEGSLLPDTYKFARGLPRQALLDIMAANHRKALDQAWTKRQPDLPLKTPEEAVVLASVVEKETGRRDEHKKVAAVFVNRLRKGMKLESDPTILYGIAGGKVQWGSPILKSEIQQKTAHNTYQIPGLPPTPICNPGLASLQAVLDPANTTDLFFVADGKGGHVFSRTLKDHEAAVAKWRLIEKEYRAKQIQAATRSVVKTVPDKAVVPPVKAVPPANPVTTVPTDPVQVQPAAKPPANPVTTVPTPASGAPAAPAEPPAATADVPLPVRKPKR